MLFSIMQHVQPGIIIEHMQSQQAMIIFALDESPLMQLIVHPISVISILHIPIDIEQLQTIIPFIMMQQPIIPPAIMLHRFCNIAADILSSHVHMQRMPPDIFSILIVQRGTIIIPEPMLEDIPGIMPGIDIWPIDMPEDIGIDEPIIMPRSIIVIVLMV